MTGKCWYVPAIALCLSAAVSAEDGQVVSLARDGKWEIKYDEDACHLTARFGEGKQSAIARLTRYQPGARFDLSLYGEPFKGGLSPMKVQIGFGLGAPTRRNAILGTAGNNLPLMLFWSLRLDGSLAAGPEEARRDMDQADEAKANVIDIVLSGDKHYRLETGSFRDPMGAMRSCLANLVRQWGYDPVVRATLKTPATPTKPPSSWLGADDYPAGARSNGDIGLVQFRLDIAEDGLVTGCHILHRTRPDDFANATCKALTKRAKFTPALDKDGKPVRDFYIGMVRFGI